MGERIRVTRIAPGEYAVIQGSTQIGDIVRDGRPGVDNYPWTWSLSESPFGSGPADTKRSALRYLTAHLAKQR